MAASKESNDARTATPEERRNFRRLLGASSVSMLGSHVTTIAYPLLVLHLTGSPVTAGLVAFAANAPGILAPLPAGVLADRWKPKRTVLLSESLRGVAVAAVVIAVVTGITTVPLLVAVAFIEGALEVLSELSLQRLARSLLDGRRVSSAQVSLEARTHVALVAGRLLGSMLFGLSPVLPFLTDVLSFISAVPIVSRISNDNLRSCRAARKSSLADDVKLGFRQIKRDQFARMAIVICSIGTLIVQALIMVFLSAAQRGGLPGYVIGVTLAASGIGGTFGSLASRRLHTAKRSWIRIQMAAWAAAFALLTFPVERSFFGYATVMTVIGFAGALGNIELRRHIMHNTDEAMLARTTSISTLATSVGVALGPVLGGLLFQQFGVQWASICLFLCALVLMLVSFRMPTTPQDQWAPPTSEGSGQNPASEAAESRHPEGKDRYIIIIVWYDGPPANRS
jgi:MFS family permease